MKNKNIIFIVVSCLTALAVVSVLLYSNFGILKVLVYFEKPDPYQGKTILFYGDGCQQCKLVDDFILANKVEAKIAFLRVEVFNNIDNSNSLIDKAKYCGLDVKDIGVPFLWNDQFGKCVIGYADIINFFKEELKKP